MPSVYFAFSERGRDGYGRAGCCGRYEDGLPAGFGRQPWAGSTSPPGHLGRGRALFGANGRGAQSGSLPIDQQPECLPYSLE